MKYFIYFFPALMLTLATDLTMAVAADFPTPTEVMVVANKSVELDVTMEMLDEDAQTSSDIIHVIELPVQEMHQERLRNQRRIREDGAASPLRQEQDSRHGQHGDLNDQIRDLQQEAEEAKHSVNDDLGQKRGR